MEGSANHNRLGKRFARIRWVLIIWSFLFGNLRPFEVKILSKREIIGDIGIHIQDLPNSFLSLVSGSDLGILELDREIPYKVGILKRYGSNHWSQILGYKWEGRRLRSVRELTASYNPHSFLVLFAVLIRFLCILTLAHSSWFFVRLSVQLGWAANMTQGDMVRKEMAGKMGEVTKTKMRIKIPHFDNSALIKGYSKTLIGRCMNPVCQDMKALLFMLPKIWKVEGKVAAADLGQGRFQFDFDNEEDIVEVMKTEPFHFDYWMLSIVR